MVFALLGGDDRSVRLCRLLRADGHTVRAFALEQALPENAADARAAVEGADCIVLPLPCETRTCSRGVPRNRCAPRAGGWVCR